MNSNNIDLSAIGASDSVFAAFEPYRRDGLVLGRITAVHRGAYRMLSRDGESGVEPLGSLLYRGEIATVGDWVATLNGMVHAILPRRTVFSRRAVGGREEEQLIAANVDLVFIVCGLDGNYNPRRLERYLTAVNGSGARAVLVLTKSDLCMDLAARVRETEELARGAPVAAVTCVSPGGMDPVRRFLGHGITAALTGSSGAGKSTLVNRLLEQDRQATQPVREHDSKGRHTTTVRELIPLPGGGALIDSPGMRELQLWAGAESVDAAFGEIAELASQCRFRDCSHRAETGCAVREAVDPQRLGSYHKLQAEIAWHDRKEDVQAAQAQKQKWKAIHKAMRAGKTRFPF